MLCVWTIFPTEFRVEGLCSIVHISIHLMEVTSSAVNVRNMFGRPHVSTMLIRSFKQRLCQAGVPGIVAGMLNRRMFRTISSSDALLWVLLYLSISRCKIVVVVLFAIRIACFSCYIIIRYGLWRVNIEKSVWVLILMYSLKPIWPLYWPWPN